MDEEKKEEAKENTEANTDPSDELKEKLELCRKEADEYLNGWRRAKADLINYKKEELTRSEIVIKFSNESLLKDLLTVMDSFDLASASENNLAGDKGFALIKSQFENILKRNGLVPIKALGEKFNPEFHEAVAEESSDKPAGIIIEEITRGWKLHEKVLRASQVKISKGSN